MAPMNWGLIGGGAGSQIGPAHRLGARLDDRFRLTACALDADPERGRATGVELGVEPSRSYGDWREMLAGESARSGADRLALVTVATPNATHYEIARAFLEAGFDVFCEKPMTMTVEEAQHLVTVARDAGRLCAVNYGYCGYPMVRQMRAMVAEGQIGAVRLVKAEFAHGFHADAADMDNPRVRWRYDPAQAGASAQFADCGIHALHMASYVTGQEALSLSAHFASLVPGRALEDDAYVNVTMDGGALVRLWTSSIAVGSMHGLALQLFGETGGLAWRQEQPNQLMYTPVGGRTQIIERGEPGLARAAQRASRVTIGHTEGMPLAFANLYRDLADAIENGVDDADRWWPDAVDGLRSMAAIDAAVGSARDGGALMDARPPMLR